MIELRTYTFIDSLQPQLASFIGTISKGFLPLERQAALFIEVAPGMSINIVTDVVLKQTDVIPGMQIVERAFGMLEVHSWDQGMVQAAGRAALDYFQLQETDRLEPRIVSEQIITGLNNHHTQLINRMRHGDFVLENEAMLVLEVHPAGYAAIAANEAEKASPIRLLEVITFGAYGRLWLGGKEAEIEEAAKAIRSVLSTLHGRKNTGKDSGV
jgi:ethanolamine utilization microcompartment shell protein EutS